MGPSEITIFRPDVLAAVDGPGNHCTKSAWYDALHPESLTNAARDKRAHALRRRMWDYAFTTKGNLLQLEFSSRFLELTSHDSRTALSGYHPKIVQYAERLDAQIQRSTGKLVDASSPIYEFSFDLMGDFAFARKPDQDVRARRRWFAAISSLQNGMALLGPLSPVPWLLHIGLSMRWIPLIRDWKNMVAFCKSCMEERLQVRISTPRGCPLYPQG
jgi:hypothetical protein